MREKLRRLAAEAFQLPLDQVDADASNETVEGWDSLHHLELMLAVELEFGVTITSQAMPELLSLEAIEEHLREQGIVATA